jgi:aarF domain-containing kinase
MFDEELCSYLSTLHSNAPAHSWECTQTTVEEALGISPGTLFEVFDSFDIKPLASGSIAQIHKAVLKPPSPHQGHHITSLPSSTGIAIAIKVRHPMVAEMIDWDFRIMLRIADIVDSISALKWLNVRSSVEQFSHTMAAQAHLDIEAHHLEVLNYNFRRWKTVGFPRPCYATNSIICETFEKGEVITAIIDQYEHEAQRLGRPGYEHIPRDLAKFLVTNGLSVYMKMLLVDNLMHADLHPVGWLYSFDSFSVYLSFLIL